MSWIREYQLVIGFPFSLSDEKNYKDGKFQKQTDISTLTDRKDNAFIFSGYYDETGNYVGGLNINFNATKDDTAKTNDCTITIDNLSNFIVDYIQDNLENNIAVRLDAGYRDEGMKTIFTGYLDDMKDKWDTTTRQTELTFGDGTMNIAAAHTSKAYPKGTPVKDIAKDVAKDLGTPIAEVDMDEDEVTQGSVAYVGPTIEVLKQIAHPREASVHIQDGRVHIQRDSSLHTQEVAYISVETGLIGVPERFSHTKKKPKGQKTKQKQHHPKGYKAPKIMVEGVKFECLLNGAITIGSTVYLKSREYDGQFKVTKVTHQGTLLSGDWKTTCECALSERSVKR